MNAEEILSQISPRSIRMNIDAIYFKEMGKFISGLFDLDLEKQGVQFKVSIFFCGPHVELFQGEPNRNNRILSAICHDGSYGCDEGLIEIMGLLTDEEREEDSVVGHLTAENVLDRVRKYLKEKE